MDRKTYERIEGYMLKCMNDSAHDKDHIYRVLYTALDIAANETNVNADILITACLLHDIGRGEQFENPDLCHAEVGGDKAYAWLTENGYDAALAEHVRQCIRTHRYRSDRPPVNMEAKILFDADKLEVTGAIGIARTLLYGAQIAEPLYSLGENGEVSDGAGDTVPSFFQEYRYKLEGIYDRFHTKRGYEIAQGRRSASEAFYANMLQEVRSCYTTGRTILGELCDR